MNSLTPTEQRLYDLLFDGLPHVRPELERCLGDELAMESTLSVHLTNLKRKLAVQGEGIFCSRNGTVTYRLVRFIQRE